MQFLARSFGNLLYAVLCVLTPVAGIWTHATIMPEQEWAWIDIAVVGPQEPVTVLGSVALLIALALIRRDSGKSFRSLCEQVRESTENHLRASVAQLAKEIVDLEDCQERTDNLCKLGDKANTELRGKVAELESDMAKQWNGSNDRRVKLEGQIKRLEGKLIVEEQTKKALCEQLAARESAVAKVRK